jgi:hypothetical protein
MGRVVDADLARRYGLPEGTVLREGSGPRLSLAAGEGDTEVIRFTEAVCRWCVLDESTPFRGLTFQRVVLPGGFVGGAYLDPGMGIGGQAALYNGYGVDGVTLLLDAPRQFRGLWVQSYADLEEFWVEGYLGGALVGVTPRVRPGAAWQPLAGFPGTVDRLVLRRTDMGRDYYRAGFTSGWYRVDAFSFGPRAVDNPIRPEALPDPTPPEITVAVHGAQGAGDWFTSDVTVTWRVDDTGSEIRESTGCEESVVDRDTDGATLTCTATSAGGTATRQVTVRRDASPPEVVAGVEGTRGAAGWYRSDVRVSWQVSDPTSGVDTACDDTVVREDTPGVSVACAAANGAGLRSAAALTVRRDATAPVIRFDGNLGSYTVDQTVRIGCTATDATSGVASATCPGADAPAHAFAPGTHRLSATATDAAGNSTTLETSFTVAVTSGGVCALVQRWVTRTGVAQSLCAKLDSAAGRRGDPGILAAFAHEVDAQTGKTITAEHAAILKRLVQAL